MAIDTVFQDETGFQVQIHEQRDGKVVFFPQGGGPQRVMPQQEFERYFKVAPPPVYKPITVSADFLEDGRQLAAYGNGRRWNGWAMPMFDRAVGLELCRACPNIRYDLARDAFVADMGEGEEPEVYTATTVTVSGQELKVYPIGAGSWIWDEVEQPSAPVPLDWERARGA